MNIATWIDAGCLAVFLCFWFGYASYSNKLAKHRNSLSGAMQSHRIAWMQNCMVRRSHIDDVELIANLDRQRAFYSSTTLLIMAGLLTSLSQVEAIQHLLAGVRYALPLEPIQVEVRLLALLGIFVYAYFTFTWSLRQLSFASVMLGAGQFRKGIDSDGIDYAFDSDAAAEYARLSAKVMDLSAHSFNNGLRAYYFSLAAVAWFYHPVALILSCAFVVAVLYRREFSSKTLKILISSQKLLEHRASDRAIKAIAKPK